jgi:hypothetical protein
MKYRRAASLLLVLLAASIPTNAAKRNIVPVPAWSEIDGTHWGELVIGQTTRVTFERDYSSSETSLPGVLEGNTSNRTSTELFLAFDGPGPDARLAWILCFYDSDRGAPTPLEFEGRFGSALSGGYPPRRRADWRLRVAAERGVAAVMERGERRERVAALLVSRSPALADVARGLSERETEVESSLTAADREPLIVQVAYVDVNVDVDRALKVDRRDLRRELERAAESQARLQSSLRVGGAGGGRLAVAVDLEPRKKREEDQIRITARATLDGGGPYGIVSVRGGESTRDLAADSGSSRVEREARRLVEQVVSSIAGSAQSQLQERRQKALAAARREARLALVASLVR